MNRRSKMPFQTNSRLPLALLVTFVFPLALGSQTQDREQRELDRGIDPKGAVEVDFGKIFDDANQFQELLKDEKNTMIQYNLWLASALALAGKQEEAYQLLDQTRVRGRSVTPVTEYAIRRTWPMSEQDAQTFFKGLRLAGFPDVLKGSVLPK